MNVSKVDYNHLASTYDQRYEFNRLAGVESALRAIKCGRALEAGCGTGRWLNSTDTGLDLSRGMLERARLSGAALVEGDACRLPFRNSSFDTVYVVNAVHHFTDSRQFIVEARRTLRRGGKLAIAGIEPRQHRSSWYVYDYFEGTWERDLERFPAHAQLIEWLASEGFRDIKYEALEHVVNTRVGADVLADPFLVRRGNSQLALLTDEAYERGIDAIRAAVARDPATVFRAELTLDMIVGSL